MENKVDTLKLFQSIFKNFHNEKVPYFIIEETKNENIAIIMDLLINEDTEKNTRIQILNLLKLCFNFNRMNIAIFNYNLQEKEDKNLFKILIDSYFSLRDQHKLILSIIDMLIDNVTITKENISYIYEKISIHFSSQNNPIKPNYNDFLDYIEIIKHFYYYFNKNFIHNKPYNYYFLNGYNSLSIPIWNHISSKSKDSNNGNFDFSLSFSFRIAINNSMKKKLFEYCYLSKNINLLTINLIKEEKRQKESQKIYKIDEKQNTNNNIIKEKDEPKEKKENDKEKAKDISEDKGKEIIITKNNNRNKEKNISKNESDIKIVLSNLENLIFYHNDEIIHTVQIDNNNINKCQILTINYSSKKEKKNIYKINIELLLNDIIEKNINVNDELFKINDITIGENLYGEIYSVILNFPKVDENFHKVLKENFPQGLSKISIINKFYKDDHIKKIKEDSSNSNNINDENKNKNNENDYGKNYIKNLVCLFSPYKGNINLFDNRYIKFMESKNQKYFYHVNNSKLTKLILLKNAESIIPLLELMYNNINVCLEHNDLLYKFIEMIIEIISNRQKNMKEIYNNHLFYHISLFLENMPNKLFNKDLMIILLKLGKNIFDLSNEENNLLYKDYFNWIFMNKDILYKFDDDTQIYMWKNLNEFKNQNSQHLVHFLKLFDICRILLYNDEPIVQKNNELTPPCYCCEYHCLAIIENKKLKNDTNNNSTHIQVMTPSIEEKNKYIKEIILKLFKERASSFSVNSEEKNINYNDYKQLTEFCKIILHLLALEKSPCLTKTLLSILNELLVSVNVKQPESKNFLIAYFIIRQLYEEDNQSHVNSNCYTILSLLNIDYMDIKYEVLSLITNIKKITRSFYSELANLDIFPLLYIKNNLLPRKSTSFHNYDNIKKEDIFILAKKCAEKIKNNSIDYFDLLSENENIYLNNTIYTPEYINENILKIFDVLIEWIKNKLFNNISDILDILVYFCNQIDISHSSALITNLKALFNDNLIYNKLLLKQYIFIDFIVYLLIKTHNNYQDIYNNTIEFLIESFSKLDDYKTKHAILDYLFNKILKYKSKFQSTYIHNNFTHVLSELNEICNKIFRTILSKLFDKFFTLFNKENFQLCNENLFISKDILLTTLTCYEYITTINQNEEDLMLLIKRLNSKINIPDNYLKVESIIISLVFLVDKQNNLFQVNTNINKNKNLSTYEIWKDFELVQNILSFFLCIFSLDKFANNYSFNDNDLNGKCQFYLDKFILKTLKNDNKNNNNKTYLDFDKEFTFNNVLLNYSPNKDIYLPLCKILSNLFFISLSIAKKENEVVELCDKYKSFLTYIIILSCDVIDKEKELFINFDLETNSKNINKAKFLKEINENLNRNYLNIISFGICFLFNLINKYSNKNSGNYNENLKKYLISTANDLLCLCAYIEDYINKANNSNKKRYFFKTIITSVFTKNLTKSAPYIFIHNFIFNNIENLIEDSNEENKKKFENTIKLMKQNFKFDNYYNEIIQHSLGHQISWDNNYIVNNYINFFNLHGYLNYTLQRAQLVHQESKNKIFKNETITINTNILKIKDDEIMKFQVIKDNFNKKAKKSFDTKEILVFDDTTSRNNQYRKESIENKDEQDKIVKIEDKEIKKTKNEQDKNVKIDDKEIKETKDYIEIKDNNENIEIKKNDQNKENDIIKNEKENLNEQNNNEILIKNDDNNQKNEDINKDNSDINKETKDSGNNSKINSNNLNNIENNEIILNNKNELNKEINENKECLENNNELNKEINENKECLENNNELNKEKEMFTNKEESKEQIDNKILEQNKNTENQENKNTENQENKKENFENIENKEQDGVKESADKKQSKDIAENIENKEVVINLKINIPKVFGSEKNQLYYNNLDKEINQFIYEKNQNHLNDINQSNINIHINHIQKRRYYKKLKRKLFSWIGSWSNKKLFYDSNNIYHLKEKVLNHYTKYLSKPFLVPILDIFYYIPKFTNFDMLNMFNDSENAKNNNIALDIHKIINSINSQLSQTVSDETEVNELNQPPQTTEKKQTFECCLVKASHHIQGYFITEETCLQFRVYLNKIERNAESKKTSESDTQDDDEFDDVRNTCFGSYFVTHSKDKDHYIYQIEYKNIKYVIKRNYYYKESGLEIFTYSNKSYYYNFKTQGSRNLFYIKLNLTCSNLFKVRNILTDKIIGFSTVENEDLSIDNLLNMWKEYKISNFEFLMYINILSNRSFSDISQYPVFPWIFSEYSDEEIISEKSYRDLSLPMGMLELNESGAFRKQTYISNYTNILTDYNFKKKQIEKKKKKKASSKNLVSVNNFSPNNSNSKNAPLTSKNSNKNLKNFNFLDLDEDDEDLEDVPIPYYYGSHYSNPLYIAHFLTRIFPFSHIMIELQGDKFDDPNRLFTSIKSSFEGASTQKGDIRELIPEFFYFPEIFINVNNLNLGIKADKTIVNNVYCPKWANDDPYKFVCISKNHLENVNVNFWIDLIFGYKQKGQNAINNHNVFMSNTYFENFNIEQFNKSDKIFYYRLVEFGITPAQVFKDKVISKKKYCEISKDKSITLIENNDFSAYNLLINEESKRKTSFENIINNNNTNDNQNNNSNEKIVIKVKALDNDDLVILYLHGQGERIHIKEKSNNKYKMKSQKFQYGYTLLLSNTDDNYLTPSQKFLLIFNGSKYDKNVPVELYHNGGFVAEGGLQDGSIILTNLYDDNYKKLTVINKGNTSPINLIRFNEKEDMAICSNEDNIIYVFKINLVKWDLYKTLYDNSNKINEIYLSNELNICCTCSEDNFFNVYIMPNYNLIRSIIVEKPLFCLASGKPLGIYIIFTQKSNKFLVYSLNGKLLFESNEGSTPKNSLIFSDFSFKDYLIYYKNGFIYLKELPYMEQLVIINVYSDSLNSNTDLNNECDKKQIKDYFLSVSKNCKFLYLVDELGKSILTIKK